MRIHKKHFPQLFKALEYNRFELKFNSPPDYEDNIHKNVKNIFDYCTRRPLKYITEPVVRAVDFADSKTTSKLLSLRNEVEGSRCILFKAPDQNWYETAFYQFEKQDTMTVFLMFGYSDDKARKMGLSWFIVGGFNHDDVKNKYMVGNFSYLKGNGFQVSGFGNENHSMFCTSKIELMIQFEVFLQYAEIETKVLKPNEKEFNGVLCKYENKLPVNVEFIDSTWYTNLIKSESFKVRGHFRLQACGEGLSKRKLIWINEFQKEGYTREAKILSE